MNKRFMQRVSVNPIDEDDLGGGAWNGFTHTNWAIFREEGETGFRWTTHADWEKVSPAMFRSKFSAFEDMVKTKHWTAEMLAAGAATQLVGGQTDEERCYFALAKEVGRVKVGKTVDVASRMSQIRGMSPVIVDVYGVIGNAKTAHVDMETLLHMEFKQYRTHGEWFTWNDAIRRRLDLYLEYWRVL